MGIFYRLVHLYSARVPREDFLTELVAYLFENDRDLLAGWLAQVTPIRLYGDWQYSVRTQARYKQLDTHEMSSRPDIEIEIQSEEYFDIVLVESKIDSFEHDDQLKRYAEQIAHCYPNARHRVIIYLTQFYDLKNQDNILREIPGKGIIFEQCRWNQFHEFLSDRKPDEKSIESEIIKFLEEEGMSDSNQFSPIDIITMSNFRKVYKIMDAAVEGEIRAKFKTILNGQVTKPITDIEYGRYALMAWNQQFAIGLGFFHLDGRNSGYPAVGLYIWVGPDHRADQRSLILSTMHEISNGDGWGRVNLDSPKAWSSIFYKKGLNEFINHEDHLLAVQEFLSDCLDKLDETKQKYPQLPWPGANK